MENKLVNGDYVPNGLGGIVRQTGTAALLSGALFRLTCHRGSFPLLPALGSRLYLLGREKPASRAMAAQQYAQEALEDLDLQVTDASVAEQTDGTLAVSLRLQSAEETLDLEVLV